MGRCDYVHMVRKDSACFDLVADSLGLGKNSAMNNLSFHFGQSDGLRFLASLTCLECRDVAGADLAVLHISSFVPWQPTAIGCPGDHVTIHFGHARNSNESVGSWQMATV